MFICSENLWRNLQIRTLYFQQKLDHFNLENNRKWNQRYWVSATYHRKTGPAFLFLNGEANLDSNALIFPNTWLAYAKEVNAISFSLDHRFYGESWPANETITYLSTRQALADVENFIKCMTKEFKFKHIKWIVFGCSYAGNLATWARLKHPNLIHGAVASSAPLLATAGYAKYTEIMEQSLKAYDPMCLESISSAIEEIASYEKMNKKFKVEKNMSSIASTSKIINLLWPPPPEYKEPVDVLYKIMHTLECVTKYDEIPNFCDAMMHYEGSKVQAYFELGNKINCKEIDEAMAPKNYVDNPNARIIDGWRYQRCSELGAFPLLNSTNFLSPVTYAFPQFEFEANVKGTCYQFFGSNFSLEVLNENVKRTNLLYGGLDININNMIFIHGSLDPLHPLGLYEKRNDSLYETIFIKGTSHCTDLKTASDKDIPDLKNARNRTLKLLKSWLEK